eukprot:3701510-Alexandrium_andersonii.AAC.1
MAPAPGAVICSRQPLLGRCDVLYGTPGSTATQCVLRVGKTAPAQDASRSNYADREPRVGGSPA